MPQNLTGTESSGTLSDVDIRTIAKRQKILLICILIYLIAVISQFALPEAVRPMLGLLIIPVSLTAMVFIFLLATKIYSTGVGVLLGILTLIPLIGLIPLLMVSGKATGILREHGIQVGLLGAKM